MKIHWHLGSLKKTACGRYAYPSDVTDEYITARNDRLECTRVTRKVTCGGCQRVLLIGKYERRR